MYNFNFYNPTEIIFGANSVLTIGKKVKEYSKNVLIVHSKSAQQYKYLDSVCRQLDFNNIKYTLLDNISQNPTLSKVYEGMDICKKKHIDFIIGIGGASVIDTVKTIAVAAKNETDIWELICEPNKINNALPFATIITLFGSGSEMTNGAVITNENIREKRGFDSVHMFPKFSILDVNQLLTVPDRYLITGIIDMSVHVLERYFELPDYENPLSDDFCEALLRDIIKNSREVRADNVNSLNNLLWDSTLAQNQFLTINRRTDGEWVSHIISHEFCAKYNCVHGEVVGILFLSWLKFIKPYIKKRSNRLLRNVFGASENDVVSALKKWLKSIGAPTSLSNLNIGKIDFEEIAKKSLCGKQLGKYRNLEFDDILSILERA